MQQAFTLVAVVATQARTLAALLDRQQASTLVSGKWNLKFKNETKHHKHISQPVFYRTGVICGCFYFYSGRFV